MSKLITPTRRRLLQTAPGALGALAFRSTSAGAAGVGDAGIHAIPGLYSWVRGGPPNAAGIYLDKGPQGNHWVQTTAANRPHVLEDWRGSGLGAWRFDGVSPSVNISTKFIAPTGDVSAAFVCEVDPALGGYDEGRWRTLLTAKNYAGGNVSWFMGHTSLRPRLLTTASAFSLLGTPLTPGAPAFIVYSWSAAYQQLAISVNGGSWATMSTTAKIADATPTDVGYSLGAYTGTTNTRFYSPWWGAVGEVMIFNYAMAASSRAANFTKLWAAVQANWPFLR